MVISSQGRYTAVAIFLHWLIFALLIAQYIVGWTMPHIGRHMPVTTLISLHFSIGVIVVRLIWRAIHAVPPPEAGSRPGRPAPRASTGCCTGCSRMLPGI